MLGIWLIGLATGIVLTAVGIPFLLQYLQSLEDGAKAASEVNKKLNPIYLSQCCKVPSTNPTAYPHIRNDWNKYVAHNVKSPVDLPNTVVEAFDRMKRNLSPFADMSKLVPIPCMVPNTDVQSYKFALQWAFLPINTCLPRPEGLVKGGLNKTIWLLDSHRDLYFDPRALSLFGNYKNSRGLWIPSDAVINKSSLVMFCENKEVYNALGASLAKSLDFDESAIRVLPNDIGVEYAYEFADIYILAPIPSLGDNSDIVQRIFKCLSASIHINRKFGRLFRVFANNSSDEEPKCCLRSIQFDDDGNEPPMSDWVCDPKRSFCLSPIMTDPVLTRVLTIYDFIEVFSQHGQVGRHPFHGRHTVSTFVNTLIQQLNKHFEQHLDYKEPVFNNLEPVDLHIVGLTRVGKSTLAKRLGGFDDVSTSLLSRTKGVVVSHAKTKNWNLRIFDYQGFEDTSDPRAIQMYQVLNSLRLQKVESLTGLAIGVYPLARQSAKDDEIMFRQNHDYGLGFTKIHLVENVIEGKTGDRPIPDTGIWGARCLIHPASFNFERVSSDILVTTLNKFSHDLNDVHLSLHQNLFEDPRVIAHMPQLEEKWKRDFDEYKSINIEDREPLLYFVNHVFPLAHLCSVIQNMMVEYETFNSLKTLKVFRPKVVLYFTMSEISHEAFQLHLSESDSYPYWERQATYKRNVYVPADKQEEHYLLPPFELVGTSYNLRQILRLMKGITREQLISTIVILVGTEGDFVSPLGKTVTSTLAEWPTDPLLLIVTSNFSAIRLIASDSTIHTSNLMKYPDIMFPDMERFSGVFPYPPAAAGFVKTIEDQDNSIECLDQTEHHKADPDNDSKDASQLEHSSIPKKNQKWYLWLVQRSLVKQRLSTN